MSEVQNYRSIFISDVHLGSKGSQAEKILEFLQKNLTDTYYLVGDIVDFWQLANQWHWPQSHNDVVHFLLERGRSGARLIYLPGNHDDALRLTSLNQTYGAVEVVDKIVHVGVDGTRYLVIHGDQFDVVVKKARWLAFVGDWLYNFALFLNFHVNIVRKMLKLPYWSFSAWAKRQVKLAVNKMGNFEEKLSHAAKQEGAQGVICGHIHFATITEHDSFRYMNCGDWVESCTAIVEHEDGRFEILRWK